MCLKQSILLFLIVSSSLLSASGQQGTSNVDPANWKAARECWEAWLEGRKEFPIAAWAYFPRYPGTVEEFGAYRDAGMTMVQVPMSPMKYAENARKAGLELIVGTWDELFLPEKRRILETLLRSSQPPSPDIAAYLLMDEPGLPKAGYALEDLTAMLQDATKVIYAEDAKVAIPICTMLPNYYVNANPDIFPQGYRLFVTQLLDRVAPSVLISTHYPILNEGSDRPDYYANLELFRTLAQERGIGFMGFVLITEHMMYREPSESDLYWQVWSLLAYGAKGIWHYNYRIGDKGFGLALVDHKTGTPTRLYYVVKAINTEVQAAGKLLLDLDSKAVYHIGRHVPGGTIRYSALDSTGYSPVLTHVTGEDILIGEFEHREDSLRGDVYVIMANKRHGAGLAAGHPSLQNVAEFRVRPDLTAVYKYDPSTSTPARLPINSQGTYRILLKGGQGVLLRLAAY